MRIRRLLTLLATVATAATAGVAPAPASAADCSVQANLITSHDPVAYTAAVNCPAGTLLEQCTAVAVLRTTGGLAVEEQHTVQQSCGSSFSTQQVQEQWPLAADFYVEAYVSFRVVGDPVTTSPACSVASHPVYVCFARSGTSG